jgi:hypothetical protein
MTYRVMQHSLATLSVLESAGVKPHTFFLYAFLISASEAFTSMPRRS